MGFLELRRLERDGWHGVRRVYAWSFYSQGTKEDRQASEDVFLAHALEWFGVRCEPTLSPWDKGRLLAEAVARERTLLILDGIEPLQYPPGPMGGRLRAPGVQSLLKHLARTARNTENRGLCLVTTREPLTDLEQALAAEEDRLAGRGVPLMRTRRMLEHVDDGIGVHEPGIHGRATAQFAHQRSDFDEVRPGAGNDNDSHGWQFASYLWSSAEWQADYFPYMDIFTVTGRASRPTRYISVPGVRMIVSANSSTTSTPLEVCIHPACALKPW